MKKLRCKTKDCSGAELAALARKSGFLVFEGGRHSKVKTTQGNLITTIPRHNRVDQYTAKSIIGKFNKFGADIEIC